MAKVWLLLFKLNHLMHLILYMTSVFWAYNHSNHVKYLLLNMCDILDIWLIPPVWSDMSDPLQICPSDYIGIAQASSQTCPTLIKHVQRIRLVWLPVGFQRLGTSLGWICLTPVRHVRPPWACLTLGRTPEPCPPLFWPWSVCLFRTWFLKFWDTLSTPFIIFCS
jgi:hypothetical protein